MVSWDWSWSVSWGRGMVGLLLWVDSSSLIGVIGNISIISVGRVLDVLDSAIRKSNRVRSGNVGSTIGLFLSVEASLGVVISNSVGEGVWRDLIGVGLNISSLDWGMVSWGWGMIGGSGVGNNWGMVGGSSVGNNWGSMDSMSHNWCSMDSMGNWGMGNDRGMDTVGDWGD